MQSGAHNELKRGLDVHTTNSTVIASCFPNSQPARGDHGTGSEPFGTFVRSKIKIMYLLTILI